MALVKANVLHDFWDMEDEAHKTYRVGDVFEGTEHRVDGLVQKGFVERAKAPKAKPAKKAKATE